MQTKARPSFHLKTGESFELRLRSNPSTGYMWYVKKESTPLMKLAHHTQTEATEPGVGQPVFQVFRFEARASRGGSSAAALHPVLGTADARGRAIRFACDD